MDRHVADTQRSAGVYLSWELATRRVRIWNKGQKLKYFIFQLKLWERERENLEAIVVSRVFISNRDANSLFFMSFSYFISTQIAELRRDSAKRIRGYSVGSSFPRTTNESRLIASVQSYLIVINRAERMLIIAVARCDFVSIRCAPNICIRLINGAKDNANLPSIITISNVTNERWCKRNVFAISFQTKSPPLQDLL